MGGALVHEDCLLLEWTEEGRKQDGAEGQLTTLSSPLTSSVHSTAVR